MIRDIYNYSTALINYDNKQTYMQAANETIVNLCCMIWLPLIMSVIHKHVQACMQLNDSRMKQGKKKRKKKTWSAIICFIM